MVERKGRKNGSQVSSLQLDGTWKFRAQFACVDALASIGLFGATTGTNLQEVQQEVQSTRPRCLQPLNTQYIKS